MKKEVTVDYIILMLYVVFFFIAFITYTYYSMSTTSSIKTSNWASDTCWTRGW